MMLEFDHFADAALTCQQFPCVAGSWRKKRHRASGDGRRDGADERQVPDDVADALLYLYDGSGVQIDVREDRCESAVLTRAWSNAQMRQAASKALRGPLNMLGFAKVWWRLRLEDVKFRGPRTRPAEPAQARGNRNYRSRPDGRDPRRRVPRRLSNAQHLQDAADFKGRHRLYRYALSLVPHGSGLFLEFGVYKGDSINRLRRAQAGCTMARLRLIHRPAGSLGRLAPARARSMSPAGCRRRWKT